MSAPIECWFSSSLNPFENTSREIRPLMESLAGLLVCVPGRSQSTGLAKPVHLPSPSPTMIMRTTATITGRRNVKEDESTLGFEVTL